MRELSLYLKVGQSKHQTPIISGHAATWEEKKKSCISRLIEKKEKKELYVKKGDNRKPNLASEKSTTPFKTKIFVCHPQRNLASKKIQEQLCSLNVVWGGKKPPTAGSKVPNCFPSF